MQRTSILSLIGSAVLFGCAHHPEEKAQAQVQATKPQPRETQAPEPATEPSNNQLSDQDLEAVLRGSVIHFGFDDSSLLPDSRDRLQRLAPVLRDHPSARILIAGNCDERGTEEYNMVLGQKRAEVAKKYLTDLGVDTSQVDTVSYGFERPVDSGHNETAWAKNRRDEFLVAKNQ